MRSFLFVPGDSVRKFESAKKTAADALILDLEDSIAPEGKVAARGIVRQMLDDRNPAQKMYIRVNAFDTDMTLGDLAAVIPGKPDGIVLPKCAGATDVNKLVALSRCVRGRLRHRAGNDAHRHRRDRDGAGGAETDGFREHEPAVVGHDVGRGRPRRVARRLAQPHRGPVQLAVHAGARSLPDRAAAAGVVPIDTIAADINDLEGLKAESIAARQDGFMGKAVIHPKHVDVVNAAFMPTDEEIVWSERVIAAFAGNPSGVVKMDGKMLDKPHLRAAEKILASRGR